MANTETTAIEAIQQSVVSSMSSQWNQMVDFLPQLAGASIILCIGIIVAYIFKKISTTIFRRLGLDRISSKAGVSDVMQDAGLAKRPSILSGKVVFWLVLLIFMVPAANTLGLTELVKLFKGFIGFMPRIITALVIIILGMMFAQFLRRSISERPATIGSNSAKTLGNVVYGIMVMVIVLVALEQLSIETALLHNLIMLVVAGMMLAVTVSVGLGSRDIAHNLLAGVYVREQFINGSNVEIKGFKGQIQKVHALSTVIVDETGQRQSIPNAAFYASTVELGSEQT